MRANRLRQALPSLAFALLLAGGAEAQNARSSIGPAKHIKESVGRGGRRLFSEKGGCFDLVPLLVLLTRQVHIECAGLFVSASGSP